MPLEVLKTELKKQPKVMRTCRHNKHQIVMNPSYVDYFEAYKMIGIKKLRERAEILKKNKEFSEKVQLILRDRPSKRQKQNLKKIYMKKKVYITFHHLKIIRF